MPTTLPDLDASMKRTTARSMFSLAGAYLRATRPPPPPPRPVLFAVVPRLNACIRLRKGAVHLFFDHILLRQSRKTSAVRRLLVALSALPSSLASRIPGLTVIDASAMQPNADWSPVDVLLAEWQFVGVFSGTEGTVSHVLTEPRYERCFQNEVEAREEVADWLPLPPALHVEVGPDVRGWTEPFFANTARLSELDGPFKDLQSQMSSMYAATAESVSADVYIEGLVRRFDTDYPPEDVVSDRLHRLAEWAHHQLKREGVATLPIARGHGDLNPGQVLYADGEHRLIDWSESETGVVFHDYIQSALWFYGWRDLAAPIRVSQLSALREGLADTLSSLSPLLAVVLVLIEVGVKQRAEYADQRATVRSWTELATEALRIADANSEDDQPPSTSAFHNHQYSQS